MLFMCVACLPLRLPFFFVVTALIFRRRVNLRKFWRIIYDYIKISGDE